MSDAAISCVAKRRGVACADDLAGEEGTKRFGHRCRILRYVNADIVVTEDRDASGQLAHPVATPAGVRIAL